MTKKWFLRAQKIAPKGPKKCKRGPELGRIKNKKTGQYFQNKKLKVNINRFQNFFQPDPDPKVSPKGQKR